MKVEARIFDLITGFSFLMAVVYGIFSKEPVGIVALALTGGLALIVGTYFRFVARRIEPRPEDNPEAEIADGAGELGFFSPGSYWPIGLAASAAVAGVAMAFWHIWLLVIGICMLLIAIGGLVFEYHTGPNHE
jgi:predicted membrane channel-forming protein YqfA (hemolysin III family)